MSVVIDGCLDLATGKIEFVDGECLYPACLVAEGIVDWFDSNPS